MTRQKCLLALVGLTTNILLVGNTAALADDLFPPPWRGQPRTTLAEWDFVTNMNPTPPDGTLATVVGDSGGVPMAEMESDLIWDPVFNGSWHTRTEPPPLINTLVYLDIPNWIDQEPVKLIQIQITAQPRFLTSGAIEMPYVIDVGGISGGSGAGHTSHQVSVSEIEIDPLDGIWQRTETWRIEPNPDEEVITLDVPKEAFLSQIVVDTISFVPEPSTMMLVGVAVVSLGIRRRWGIPGGTP